MTQVQLPYIFVKNAYKRMVQQTAPLLFLPYEVQLKMKENRTRSALKYFVFLMTKHTKRVQSDRFYKLLEENEGMPCPVEPIRVSGILESYRNKNTASMGYDIDGNISCGHSFRYQKKQANVDRLVVMPINDLQSVNRTHAHLFGLFEAFVKTSAFAPYCCVNNRSGHWSQVLARSNVKGECMFHVHLVPQKLSPEQIEEAKSELLTHFIPTCLEEKVPLKSVQWTVHRSLSKTQSLPSVLWGDPYLYEWCLGKRFQISPHSFFQVNTPAAELLYTATREMLATNKKTILLDICCGTGTIGILMSDRVAHVIGVDIVSTAIEDAKVNAALNGVSNIEHHLGDAEDFIANLVAEKKLQDYEHVVAVVNPHRTGMSGRLMRKIRECLNINQVVYLSCQPEGRPTFNFYQLCKTSTTRRLGEPFVMTRVIPLDPFPHTKYVELVLNFERS